MGAVMRKLQLSDWASIAEVVSAIALVISLIYVGVEVHRNTVTQVQVSTQTLVSEANLTYVLIAQDPDLSCIYLQGMADFSGLGSHEKLRFSAFLMQSLRALEELHAQWLEGLVDARIWQGFDAQMTEIIQAPGFQQWWEQRRHFFSEEFQMLLDGKVAEGPGRQPMSFGAPDCSTQS